MHKNLTMKQYYTIILLLFGITNIVQAQVNITSGGWTPIGDVKLTNVTDDADNDDGVKDGAIYVDGQSAATNQGASFTFGGTMTLGQSIAISTYTYNRNVSAVNFVVQLYNRTDSSVLRTSTTIIHNGAPTGTITAAINTVLNYTALSTDVGDVLQIRYIRTDDGATSRNFAIDNLKLNGAFASRTFGQDCSFTVTPDLALIASSTAIESEITGAVTKFATAYLGSSAPSVSAIDAAVIAYGNLGITVTGTTISGNTINSFTNLGFLKTFAQYLKNNTPNPDTRDIATKANNAIWWISKQFCAGEIPTDVQLYAYEDFARSASLLKDVLNTEAKNLFAYTLYQHSVGFEHFWAPVYDSIYQQARGAIITDVVFNIGDVLLAYSLWQNTADERYRYMRAYKRYMDRFFSYTVGTNDGLKPDGSGFHHWVAYNNYMYSYSTAANILSYLNGTSFQVAPDNYKVFRDAFYAQFIQANATGVQALSTAGRNPQNRTRPISATNMTTLAAAGGKILGLTTPDPLLVAPLPSGFFQFNHAMAGTFRKDDYVVFNKGFSSSMWGAEAYTNQNRYGRYQSYGALEIVYAGDKLTGNGYDDKTWDWNFNPGTTVINLPWEKLHGEWSRLDEQQQNKFVGSLNLKNKNSELLKNNHGDFGLFAMDFKEDDSQGFGTNYTSNAKNHNTTFTFKKSNFFFDDLIVCLGSNISNNDATNETVTTLFQRLNNKIGASVNVNGASVSSLGTFPYAGTSNNWLISNYGTGFYLVSGNDNFVVKKAIQQNPNQDQTWFPAPLIFSGNTSATYYTGYINHGVNPNDKKYEYIIKPKTTASEMQTLHTTMQVNKPYTVRRQDANAHIVEHVAKKIFGYAFFNAVSGLSYSYLKAIDGSCLVMTQFTGTADLLLSIDNPDIGYVSKTNSPATTVTRKVTLQGVWTLNTVTPGVILTSTATETEIQFTLVDGLAKEVLLTNTTLGTSEFEKSGIIIYPNPANDFVTIQGIAADNIKKIRIISMLGQVVKTMETPKNQIDISNLPNGIYFVKMQLNDTKMVTKKLIIKR